ncbi:MAG: coat protein [Cressdnaviricota sp.]|nr:MAG: coat protein [Cressdnaviricota sp.]
MKRKADKYPQKTVKKQAVNRNQVGAGFQRAVVVQPGNFRLGGAYQRSNPHNFEKKYWDTGINLSAIAAVGQCLSSINLIPQDTSKNGRIGNKCTAVNINVHGVLILPAAVSGVTLVGTRVRIILYVDKQCNGVTAQPADLIKDSPTGGTFVNSFRNMDNVDRFIVLKDKTFTMNYLTAGTATEAAASVLREYKFNKKCSIPLDYSATTGALTEIRSNNIGMMFISDTNNQVSFQQISRVKFSDH